MTPQQRLSNNGYIKIFLSFLMMGFAFTMNNPYLAVINYCLGALYFCLGLKLVLRRAA